MQRKVDDDHGETMDINNMTPEQTERAEAFANKLIITCKRQEFFDSLSNEELADLLLEVVWADLPLFSNNSDIVSEAVDRLRGE